MRERGNRRATCAGTIVFVAHVSDELSVEPNLRPARNKTFGHSGSAYAGPVEQVDRNGNGPCILERSPCRRRRESRGGNHTMMSTCRSGRADDALDKRGPHLACRSQDEHIAAEAPAERDVRFARRRQTVVEVSLGCQLSQHGHLTLSIRDRRSQTSDRGARETAVSRGTCA